MSPTLAVLGLSGGELIMVLAAVLVLFGAKRIPEFAKGLGQGIKEFKKASREVQDEIQRATEDTYSPPPPPPPAPASAAPTAPAGTVPATAESGVVPIQLPAAPAPTGGSTTPASTVPNA